MGGGVSNHVAKMGQGWIASARRTGTGPPDFAGARLSDGPVKPSPWKGEGGGVSRRIRVREIENLSFLFSRRPLIRPFGAPSPLRGEGQLVEKVEMPQILCKSLAEFRHPQMTESSADLFFPGTCASEKTLLSPQACALCACDAVGCNPSSTCLHVRESLSTSSTGSPSPLRGEGTIGRPQAAPTKAGQLWRRGGSRPPAPKRAKRHLSPGGGQVPFVFRRRRGRPGRSRPAWPPGGRTAGDPPPRRWRTACRPG